MFVFVPARSKPESKTPLECFHFGTWSSIFFLFQWCFISLSSFNSKLLEFYLKWIALHVHVHAVLRVAKCKNLKVLLCERASAVCIFLPPRSLHVSDPPLLLYSPRFLGPFSSDPVTPPPFSSVPEWKHFHLSVPLHLSCRRSLHTTFSERQPFF